MLRIAKYVVLAASALAICQIVPRAAAKTDQLKCEERCQDYKCSAATQMYCQYACRKQCEFCTKRKETKKPRR